MSSSSSFYVPTMRFMPSAKRRLLIVLPFVETALLKSSRDSCMMFSTNGLNSIGDTIHPYCTPTVVRKRCPLFKIALVDGSQRVSITCTSNSSILYRLRTCQSPSC